MSLTKENDEYTVLYILNELLEYGGFVEWWKDLSTSMRETIVEDIAIRAMKSYSRNELDDIIRMRVIGE